MKKKFIEKLMALALAGAMVCGLVACGGSSDNQGATESESGTEVESPAESDRAQAEGEQPESQGDTNYDAEIYWYSCVTGWGPTGWSSGVTDSPLTQALKDKYGITLNIELPPTDAETKLGLMIATGDLPDVISVTDSDTINQLIASGKVYAMEEFFQAYDPESHIMTDFPEDIKQKLIDTYGGWYSFPSHMESPELRKLYTPRGLFLDGLEYGYNSSVMFNKTIMDELGITLEDVQTEEGFYAACEKVKNSGYTVNGQSVIPVVLHANTWINQSLDGIICDSFGVNAVDGEGHYRHKEMDPGYKNALKFVNNLITNGYLDVNSLTLDEAAVKVDLEGGRVFSWIGNPAQSGKKEQIPWTSAGPILASNGATPVAPVSMQAGTGWIQTFVSKDCKNPEAVAKLLSFGSSEEGLQLNEWGVEGVDFNYVDGVAVRTEEGQQRYENDYAKNLGLWPFANTDFGYSRSEEPNDTMDNYYHLVITSANAKYEKTYMYDAGLLDFARGTVIEPSSDLGIKLAQVVNYLESQKAKIVSATSDEAFEQEYQNMIDTLNSYSISEIDAEYDKILQQNYEKYGRTIENVNASLYE